MLLKKLLRFAGFVGVGAMVFLFAFFISFLFLNRSEYLSLKFETPGYAYLYAYPIKSICLQDSVLNAFNHFAKMRSKGDMGPKNASTAERFTLSVVYIDGDKKIILLEWERGVGSKKYPVKAPAKAKLVADSLFEWEIPEQLEWTPSQFISAEF